MTKKIAKPANPLIYRTAAEFACTFYEAGRSSGMTSKHKDAKRFAAEYMERFIPLAIKHLLEMLKPTSNITEHMRQEIHAALTDPINDPDLMEAKVNTDFNMEMLLEKKKFDKHKILTPIQTKKSVIHA